MRAYDDGRFHLEREGLIVYKGLNGTVGMAHVRLYEAGEQVPVVIVGEPKDNPGMSVTNTIETVAAAVQEGWLRDRPDFALLAYDVDEQTFSEVTFDDPADAADPTLPRFRNPQRQYVSITDVLGVMPELFNPEDYMIAERGGEQAERLRDQVLKTNGEKVDAVLGEPR